MNKNWQNVLIVSLIMIILIGPCFAIIPNFLVNKFNQDGALFWQMMSFFIAFMITLIVTFVLIRHQNIDLKDIGLFTRTPWYAILVAVILGLFWAFSSVSSLKGMDPDADVMKMWLTFNPLRFFLIIFGVIGVLIEDFITRGFIMNELKEAGLPSWFQLIFSSLLFALYHSIWMVSIIGIYFLYSFIASFIYGLLLAGLYLIGKRSLTPVMISHGLTILIGEPIVTYMLLKTFMM